MLPVTGAGLATLHWARGAVASFDDFALQTTMLKAGSKHRLNSGGGPSSSAVAMKAGMARTRLALHPGESIRTPRMMLLLYEGDHWRCTRD